MLFLFSSYLTITFNSFIHIKNIQISFDWESIIVVIEEKVDIPLSLLYSIPGQERSRTRMLDLLCAILIFKHGHAVISW